MVGVIKLLLTVINNYFVRCSIGIYLMKHFFHEGICDTVGADKHDTFANLWYCVEFVLLAK